MAQQSSSELTVLESELNMASHHVSEQKVWDFFMSLFNNNAYASAGACGNMQWESGLYSDNAENTWNDLTGKSDEWLTTNINNGTINLATFLQRSWWVNAYGFGYGLSQWTTTTRRTRLWERTIDNGLDIDDEDAQLAYIYWEFTEGGWQDVRTHMIGATSVYTATRIYCSEYEVGGWNEKRYTDANGNKGAMYFYNTYSGSTGYHINVNTTGNGTAFVVPTVVDIGDTYDLTVTPASGESLIDIVATEDATGMYVAIPVQTGTQTILMNSASNITIDVSFTGIPPTPPIPVEEDGNMPIWMYPFMKC